MAQVGRQDGPKGAARRTTRRSKRGGVHDARNRRQEKRSDAFWGSFIDLMRRRRVQRDRRRDGISRTVENVDFENFWALSDS